MTKSDRPEPSLVQNVVAINGFAYGAIGADIHVFANGLPLYLLANWRAEGEADQEWLREHSHEKGQVLHVLEGRGLVATEAGTPQPIGAGDLVWAPPGELHWHGGGPESMVLHLAISLGRTTWHGPVSDDDYGSGQ